MKVNCFISIKLVLNVLVLVTCRTVFVNLNEATRDELQFLKRYGYLDVTEDGDVDYKYTALSVSEAVARMQDFAGLQPTGELDDETRKLFKKKRCGVRDVESASTRRRRFVVSQGWSKRDITYRVLNGSSTLAKPRIEELMTQALAVWAPHGGLNFHHLARGKADIRVLFVTGNHGDGFPFDGMGQVVAHAFPPPIGAMHFDDDELWGENISEDDEEMTDFFAVVVHEIGHALGLSHSKEPSSVMYPYYQPGVERLHLDDILGIQKLYFQNQPEPAAVITESTDILPRYTRPSDPNADVDSNADADTDEDEIPDLCYSNYDTIQVIQGKIFVFEEEWVWVLGDMRQIEPGYPARFHQLFVGLPEHVTHIRTIYERLNGHIVIFSERRYWEFNAKFRLVKRGKLSHFSIPSQVSELSTVFLSNFNNKTYFIDYERFWRYDETTGKMDPGYPKSMSAWRKLPYPVDSAVIWRGDTYFFRGPRYWRFDNERIEVNEYYPLPTAQIWFPCDLSPDMDRYVTNDEP